MMSRTRRSWKACGGLAVVLRSGAVVTVVHAAFATLLAATPRREGTLGKMRLSPIAEALGRKAVR